MKIKLFVFISGCPFLVRFETTSKIEKNPANFTEIEQNDYKILKWNGNKTQKSRIEKVKY